MYMYVFGVLSLGKSVKTHLYWTMKNCCDSPDTLRDLILSIPKHYKVYVCVCMYVCVCVCVYAICHILQYTTHNNIIIVNMHAYMLVHTTVYFA